MTDRFLVDSNILVYAFDSSEKEKFEKAKKFLKESMGNGNAFLSAQNLAEFHVNITKGKNGIRKKTSIEITEALSEQFNIVNYNEKTVVKAIETEDEHKSHFWDSLLAATMQENGIRTIYTENTRDFKKIPWIKAINPV